MFEFTPLDEIPTPTATAAQSDWHQRPRTVAQQARHLEKWPPIVINNEGSRCDLCGRHKAIVAIHTIWRHGHPACEDCLRMLLSVLERNNT